MLEKMCLSRRTDMHPLIRQAEPYNQHVFFFELGSRKLKSQIAQTQLSFCLGFLEHRLSSSSRFYTAPNFVKNDLLRTCFTVGHLKSFLEIMTNVRSKWITKYQRKRKSNQMSSCLQESLLLSPLESNVDGNVTCRPLGLIHTVTFWA